MKTTLQLLYKNFKRNIENFLYNEKQLPEIIWVFNANIFQTLEQSTFCRQNKCMLFTNLFVTVVVLVYSKWWYKTFLFKKTYAVLARGLKTCYLRQQLNFFKSSITYLGHHEYQFWLLCSSSILCNIGNCLRLGLTKYIYKLWWITIPRMVYVEFRFVRRFVKWYVWYI